MRLDLYIQNKLSISRNKAQFVIRAGKVLVNDIITKKSWFCLSQNDTIKILENDESKYVARSAIKLKELILDEKIDFSDKICFDVWSSTWGFCQIMLENNAKLIYALDVWTSQLHDLLKNNPKIISIENTDIRNFDTSLLKNPIDIITCDVSFISLEKIIDSIFKLKTFKTRIILLFKPQYEVWKENLTKFWTPINQKIIDEKLNNFCLILSQKWVKIEKVILSKLTWENWNKEYFILI